jgi:hypothetical protein
VRIGFASVRDRVVLARCETAERLWDLRQRVVWHLRGAYCKRKWRTYKLLRSALRVIDALGTAIGPRDLYCYWRDPELQYIWGSEPIH